MVRMPFDTRFRNLPSANCARFHLLSQTFEHVRPISLGHLRLNVFPHSWQTFSVGFHGCFLTPIDRREKSVLWHGFEQ